MKLKLCCADNFHLINFLTLRKVKYNFHKVMHLLIVCRYQILLTLNFLIVMTDNIVSDNVWQM